MLASAARDSADSCWLVVLVTGSHQPERFAEVAAAQRILGTDYEVWGNDDCWSCDLRAPTLRQLDAILVARDWLRVVTHNPQGEYHHYQHIRISQEVTRRMTKLNRTARLSYFDPRPETPRSPSRTKARAFGVYAMGSQGFILPAFFNWTERITPADEFERACPLRVSNFRKADCWFALVALFISAWLECVSLDVCRRYWFDDAACPKPRKEVSPCRNFQRPKRARRSSDLELANFLQHVGTMP